jgi:hypothetical protein
MMKTKGDRFIDEFWRDFSDLSRFKICEDRCEPLRIVSIGLDTDIETGVVRPAITVEPADATPADVEGKRVTLHENVPVYDPDFHTAGELIEMLVDTLKLPEPVIRERLKKAGLLEDSLDQT